MSKIKEFNELYLAKERLFRGNVPSRNGNQLIKERLNICDSLTFPLFVVKT
jgi:hypothetical protein